MEIKSIEQWAKANPLLAIALLVTPLVLLNDGVDSASDFFQQGQTLRTERKALQQQQIQLEIAQDAAAELEAIAIGRYESGCILVTALDQPDQFVSIVENMPVLDRATQSPLPAGTAVCDANGNTAVLTNQNINGEVIPVASSLAFTGDRGVIEAAITNQQVTAEYNQPAQEVQ
jgi:hypothetical protein